MKSVPLCASSKRPVARLHRAGERALHVSEQLRLGEAFGNRRGVERDEVLIADAGCCDESCAR